jgi:hypothetical protein
LDGPGYYFSVAIIPDKKMNMIGGDCVIEDAEAMAFLCLKEPLEIPAAVSGKFQEKFFLMTSVGGMPNTPWYVMPVCSRHDRFRLKTAFSHSKTLL